MASIGVDNNGKAWIKPPVGNIAPKGALYTKIGPNYNSISYRHLKSVIDRGNVICRKPYSYGAGHGRISTSYRSYDCSSAASTILHPIYKSGVTNNSTWFRTYWGSFKPHDKKWKSLGSLAVRANDNHMWIEIWWLGNRISFDNHSGRNGHSMWYDDANNPNRSKKYPIKYRRL